MAYMHIRSLQAIDPNSDAIIDLDYLGDFSDAVYPVVNEYFNLSEDISGFVSTHGEHLSLSLSARSVLRTAADNTAGDLTRAKTLTKEQYEAMGYFDYGFGASLDEVARMLRGISDLSRQNQLGHDRVTFRPGSFMGSRLYNNIGINQNMKDSLAERYFDANGNLDHFRVGFTIFSGHEHGLSDLELQVLLQTFNSQNTPSNPNGSLDAMLESYGKAFFILAVSQDPTMLHVYDVSVSTDDDFRNLIDKLAGGGSPIVTFNPPLPNSNQVLQQLTDTLVNNVITNAETLLGRNEVITEAERRKLSEELAQLQLMAFLNEIGLSSTASGIDISGFGKIDAYGNLEPGVISIGRNNYATTSLGSLISRGAFANEAAINAAQANLNSTQINTGNALFSILLDAVGFVPGKAGTASGIISSGINVMDIIAGLTDDRAVQEYLARMYALGNSVLGSGVIAIKTPNGFHVVATSHNNPNVAINVAGLGERGISVADVTYAWMHGDQGVQSSVNNFLDVNSLARDCFITRLEDAFNRYMENGRLVELFGVTHPNLSNITNPERLPLDVLEYLFSVMEGRP